jgi:hypothetical protein
MLNNLKQIQQEIKKWDSGKKLMTIKCGFQRKPKGRKLFWL